MLKMADSAVLREKPVISPGKASVTESTLPRIYKKILSRDRKPLLKGLFLGVFSLLSFFFRYLLFSTNYFSTPRGYVKTKKVLHTLYGRLLIFPTILLVWVVWASSRRSSRSGPLRLHSCRWPSQSADQPCAAALALSSSASSPSPH